MEIWDNDDCERPLESYPGYLGVLYDGSFICEPELAILRSFDFREYSELVDQHGGKRLLKVPLPSGVATVEFESYDDLARILDQLPTIEVRLDLGPPDAGPASGGLYVFFVAAGVSREDVKDSVCQLTQSLGADWQEMLKKKPLLG
jgi:hypothetical protein